MKTYSYSSRPILFSGPMVRAILEGRKTQTRRVAAIESFKLTRHKSPTDGEFFIWHASFTKKQNGGVRASTGGAGNSLTESHAAFARRFCPYGQPGDRLWVKETHRFDGLDPKIAIRNRRLDEISYRADMEGDRSCDECRWRPSIFMPRWASRITLEIVEVRVERLQDISEEDAQREGLTLEHVTGCATYSRAKTTSPWIIAFQELWESINGPGSWDANPWVWVLTFRRVERREP